MGQLLPLFIAFLSGGFGKVAESHLMDPTVAIAIGTVSTYILGRVAVKFDAKKPEAK